MVKIKEKKKKNSTILSQNDSFHGIDWVWPVSFHVFLKIFFFFIHPLGCRH